MKKIFELMVVLAILSVPVLAQTLTPETQHQAEVQQLKEQLFQANVTIAQLKFTLAQTQAQLDNVTLSAAATDLKQKHSDLEWEMKFQLGGQEDGDSIDWTKTPPVLVKGK